MINHNIKSLPPAKKLMESLQTHIDSQVAIKAWLNDPRTKKGDVNCKRRSLARGLAEFKKLYDVSEFWMSYPAQTDNWKDDSIEIHYRKKETV
jgi:hypothetical protein